MSQGTERHDLGLCLVVCNLLIGSDFINHKPLNLKLALLKTPGTEPRTSQGENEPTELLRALSSKEEYEGVKLACIAKNYFAQFLL